MNKVDTLRLAQDTYAANHILSRKDRKLNAKLLRDEGWPIEAIAKITNLSIALVRKVVDYNPNYIGGARYMGDKFNPDTLDAIIYITVSYADEGFVPYKLVSRVLVWGTGLYMLSFLTGIPVEELRVGD